MGDYEAKKPGRTQAHERPASTDVADLADHGLMSASIAKREATKPKHDFVREITSKRADGHYTIITISKNSEDVVAEDSQGYIHGILGAQFRVAAVTELEVIGIVHMSADKLDLSEHPTVVLNPSKFPKAGEPVELKGQHRGLEKDTEAVPHAYWFDDDTGRFGFTVDKGEEDGIQAGMQGSLVLPDGDPHNYGPFTIVSVGQNESKAVTVATYSEKDYEYVKEKIVHNHKCIVHAAHKAHAPHRKAAEARKEF
jgi:hypothetical protein